METSVSNLRVIYLKDLREIFIVQHLFRWTLRAPDFDISVVIHDATNRSKDNGEIKGIANSCKFLSKFQAAARVSLCLRHEMKIRTETVGMGLRKF